MATNLFGRGMDIERVNIVFNYDMPDDSDTYLHRVSIGQDKLQFCVGAQWLSGRVLDSRPKGHGSEPHRRHCVVVLEQDSFILA